MDACRKSQIMKQEKCQDLYTSHDISFILWPTQVIVFAFVPGTVIVESKKDLIVSMQGQLDPMKAGTSK